MRKLIKQIIPSKYHVYYKVIKKKWFIVFEIVLSPLTIISCYWLKLCKRKLYVSPFTKSIFDFTGVFPILDHYYEPLYNKKHLRKSLREDRNIVSLDFNDAEQIKLIDKFSYNDELLAFPRKRTSNPLEFSYNYGDYPSGDSESLYNMMRTIKPKRMIEVGCGSSTLMAINAMKMNKKENENYDCEYTCIEPYEQPWLEKTGLKVLRKKVEDVPLDFFKTLAENDILFIDSSHMIRPQGDVLYEILEILPALNSGVIIHFHDICTPKDYFDEWVGKFMWNEQYILEAFLSNNKEYEIILSTNYLLHHHYEKFISKCPVLKFDKEQNPIRETGAFWIRKK